MGHEYRHSIVATTYYIDWLATTRLGHGVRHIGRFVLRWHPKPTLMATFNEAAIVRGRQIVAECAKQCPELR